MKRKLIILLLLAAAAGLGWFLLRPSPAPPPVVLKPTVHQVAETQKHLDVLGKTVAAPGNGPRTLRLSENDINVALASNPALKKLLTAHGVKNVQVVLQEPDSEIIHASAAVRGQTQNVQVSGTLAPDPKTGLRFTATSAEVGSLPLPPGVVTSEASGLANHFARQLLSHFSLSVQGVYVEKKDLVSVGLPSQSPAAASPQSASPARR